MKHEDRRKELGKMFLDIAKYVATAGLAGGLIAGRMPWTMGLPIILVVIILTVIGFYTIPTKKEG